MSDGGLSTDETRALEARYGVATYSQLPHTTVRGEGCWVWNSEGRRFLDLYGGHAVALTGHCHPRLVAALREQAGKLLFYSNAVSSDVRALALRDPLRHVGVQKSRIFSPHPQTRPRNSPSCPRPGKHLYLSPSELCNFPCATCPIPRLPLRASPARALAL